MLQNTVSERSAPKCRRTVTPDPSRVQAGSAGEKRNHPAEGWGRVPLVGAVGKWLTGAVRRDPETTAGARTTAGLFGVSMAGLPPHLALLESFETMVARNVDVVGWYRDFTTPTFLAADATPIVEHGSTPMITWEPWDSQLPDPVKQPGYTLATIIDGRWDELLNTWAVALTAWAEPVFLRFAHEMNGNWYPWCEGVNGNAAGQYVEAWRHVHDLFVEAGARNVKWVWSPNVDYPGAAPLAPLYPGDDYVDHVGIDGYNWGTSRSWSTWLTPEQVFGPTIAAVRRLTDQPILLTEVSSAEEGGSKGRWVSDFFAWLQATPAVTGFVWFQFQKEADWRVESSPAAQSAFVTNLKRL